MKRLAWMVLLPVMLWQVSVARATHSVTWNRDPIAIALVVGREQRLDFPEAVRAGIPASLGQGGALQVQSVGSSLYLQARAPFGTARVYATLTGTGQVVVLDVSATGAASGGTRRAAPPVRIRVSDALAASAGEEGADPGSREREQAVTPVRLARFAAQQFHAPLRLLRDHPGIERVPLRNSSADGLYAGGEVQTEVLAAWRGGHWYVTAVRLTNRTPEPVALDPRRLRGALAYAAFQHRSLRLGPHGDATDTTLVYLITDRPFDEAVLPRI